MIETRPAERTLSRWVRVALIAACAFLPTAFVAQQFAQRPDLSSIVFYGEYFQPTELPALQRLHPKLQRNFGFDGQFYAQMALDPTLRNPGLRAALDIPAYRGQRIFLPALAWLLGAGQPRAVLFVYALLNLGFWYVLLAAVARRLPAVNARSFLVLYAIMLTTGALASVRYALTDLPAVTLGFVALCAAEIPGALLISLAILTKPTAGLFLVRYIAPMSRTTVGKKGALGALVLALLPPILWQFYLRALFHDHALDLNQFAWPFFGWCQHAIYSWVGLMQARAPWNGGSWITLGAALCEVLALIGGATQAVYLAVRPRGRDPLWLAGIAFAILFFCLGDKNYENVAAYSRTVLPMTIAFNFLLLELRSAPAFLALLAAGNIGFLGGIGEMILVSCR